jgi:hypothetical protein
LPPTIVVEVGVEVFEITPYSVDIYGERRYYELGRDSTIEYDDLDRRFRNPHLMVVRLIRVLTSHRIPRIPCSIATSEGATAPSE